jgi:hypothetical protein
MLMEIRQHLACRSRQHAGVWLSRGRGLGLQLEQPTQRHAEQTTGREYLTTGADWHV